MYLSNSFNPADQTYTVANYVKLVRRLVMSRLIWFYTVFHSVLDLSITPPSAIMNSSKSKDRRVYFRNSGMKGLNIFLFIWVFVYFVCVCVCSWMIFFPTAHVALLAQYPVLEWWYQFWLSENRISVLCEINPFIFQFLKWTRLYLKLDLSTDANRNFCLEWQTV